MIIPAWLRKVHKWIGLILGIQVLLWFVSGLVMSFLPIEIVRGEHLVPDDPATPVDVAALTMPLPAVLKGFSGSQVKEVRLRNLLGRPVYEVMAGEESALIDASDGRRLDPLSEETAIEVARSQFMGAGEVRAVTLIREPNIDTGPNTGSGPKRELPLWQVSFDDIDNTRLYISPATGRRVLVRTDTWRFFDFFWMLHIMDYQGRVDINSALLVAATAISLVLILTGLWLIFYSFTGRDFRWLRRR